MEIMDTYVKISILELGYGVQTIEKKILGNIYEPKVALEDKVYLETYYRHQPKGVAMDETPIKIEAHELYITRWTLTDDQ